MVPEVSILRESVSLTGDAAPGILKGLSRMGKRSKPLGATITIVSVDRALCYPSPRSCKISMTIGIAVHHRFIGAGTLARL